MKRLFTYIIGLVLLVGLSVACTNLNEIDFVDLKVDFVPSTSVIQLGDDITFIQNSTIVARGFDWDFGDQNTSTESSPTHTYQSVGRFNVTMVATKADGLTKDSVVKQVNVLPRTLPANNTLTYGESTNEDFGFTFTPYLIDNQSGFVLVGRQNLNTLQVIRTDENTNIVWTRTFNNIADGRGQITPLDVRATFDEIGINGFVIVGFFEYNLNETDAFITKIDTAGNELWTNLVSTQNDEVFNSVRQVGSTLVVGGTTGEISNEGNFIPRITITQYSQEGDIIESSIQGSNWIVNDFEFTNDGYVLAVTEGGRPKIFDFDPSFNELLKYEVKSSTGRSFRGRALGVRQLESGDYILVGEKTYEDNPDSTTAFIAKIDELGNQVWIVDSLAYFKETLNDIVEGASGDLYAVGTHENPITGKDVLVIKYGADGSFNQVRLIGGVQDEEAFRMEIFPGDQIVVFGTTRSFGSGLRDFYMLNLDTNLQ